MMKRYQVTAFFYEPPCITVHVTAASKTHAEAMVRAQVEHEDSRPVKRVKAKEIR